MSELHKGRFHGLHTVRDVEGYSSRGHGAQIEIQSRIDRTHVAAAYNSRIDHEDIVVQERGDGDLMTWGSGTRSEDMLGAYLPELHTELTEINKRTAEDHQLRMRFSIVVGTSEPGDRGRVGDAPVVAARLADCDQAKAALKRFPRHPLVVVVDDAVYQDVIRTRIRNLNPAHYIRILVEYPAKGFVRQAWLWMPGSSEHELKDLASLVGVDVGVGVQEEETPETPPSTAPMSGSDRSPWSALRSRWALATGGAVVACAAVITVLITLPSLREGPQDKSPQSIVAEPASSATSAATSSTAPAPPTSTTTSRTTATTAPATRQSSPLVLGKPVRVPFKVGYGMNFTTSQFGPGIKDSQVLVERGTAKPIFRSVVDLGVRMSTSWDEPIKDSCLKAIQTAEAVTLQVGRETDRYCASLPSGWVVFMRIMKTIQTAEDTGLLDITLLSV